MDRNALLPFGSNYYSLARCFDHYGNQLAYRVNTWTVGYGSLPDPIQYQTAEGYVRIDYYLTEQELKEAIYPTQKPIKKHRLAKAAILGIAALSGMFDEQNFDVVGY